MGKKNNKKNKAASKQPAAASELVPEANVAEAAPATDVPVDTAVESAVPEVAEPVEATATPSDVPGGFPVTPSNEIADLEDKTVSVNPLPATAGTGNPITLAPGEKIPESITAQNVNEHVKLDKESYEKSDALPTAPALSTEIPPVSGTMIPESSLPMGDKTDVGDVTINSVGPGSTTAALAGQVPLEPKVPEVVKESQEKAGVAPEASAIPEEVEEKAKVEQQIKDEVPEVPATSVGVPGVDTEKKESSATGPAAVAGVSKATEDAAPVATDAKDNSPEQIAPEVPQEVKESIAEAGKSPEAAASTSAVEDKKQVENELLEEVKKAPAVDETTKTTETEAPAVQETAEATEPKAADATPVAPATEDTTTGTANGATVAEPKTAEPVVAANGNGTETKPAEGAAVHEKKKSRLSVMFSKLKNKLK